MGDGVDSGSDGLGVGYGGFDGPSIDTGTNGFSLDGILDGLPDNNSLGYNDPSMIGSNNVNPDIANEYGNIDLDPNRNPLGWLNHPVARAIQTIAQLNPYTRMVSNMLSLAEKAGNGRAGAGFGGVVGGVIGSQVGGFPGQLAGSQLGSMFGQSALSGNGYSGPSASMGAGASGGSPGMDMMTGGLTGLAALYQNMRNSQGLNNQIGSLQSLYGQGSPFAMQAMQKIQRSGAAGGRRGSGNAMDSSGLTANQVQLQALLAQNASNLAPHINNLMAQRQLLRDRGLAQLLGLYQQMGGYKGISNGLSSLFGGGSNPMLDNLSGPAEGLSGLSGGLTNGQFTNNPLDNIDFPDFGGPGGI